MDCFYWPVAIYVILGLGLSIFKILSTQQVSALTSETMLSIANQTLKALAGIN